LLAFLPSLVPVIEEHREPLLKERIDGVELLQSRAVRMSSRPRSVSWRARRVGSITPSTVSDIIPSLLRYRACRSPRREMRSTHPACISSRVMLLTVPRLMPSEPAI
jgi:hypothetical protein